MSLPTLVHFLDRTRLACCGTCLRWQAKHHDRYCPVVKMILPQTDLTDCGCEEHDLETHETDAVQLYHELRDEGAA